MGRIVRSEIPCGWAQSIGSNSSLLFLNYFTETDDFRAFLIEDHKETRPETGKDSQKKTRPETGKRSTKPR